MKTKYNVEYKVRTNTFPYTSTMLSVEAETEAEAMRLTEEQVAKRASTEWVRATKVIKL